jgi:alkanesulfonate monooxygenase SsuD/methylene tetrahydromethanopterin reductase-like flavin-dependent oxidoreductase (luciferase family)
VQGFVVAAGILQADDGEHREPGPAQVHLGPVAGDDPGRLQPPEPLGRRGGAEVDPPAELGERDAALPLDLRQDRPVGRVESLGPFTTLSWLAGITHRVRLGTTVLILPYRHPLLVARMAANLHQLSGGRLVLGVGVGWARQEFAALGVPFDRRGTLTDEALRTVRAAWQDKADYGHGPIPIWVGGNSDAGLRRAVRFGEAWHPQRFTLPWLRGALERLEAAADAQRRPVPGLAPRIALRLTPAPLDGTGRLAGEGTIEQITGDLDPFGGDPGQTRHPRQAWRALAAVAAALPTKSE